ncbi:transcriptional regulator, MarR family [Catenulispora acidiphila DSM 44928]|uniref:Transcriptional regulator, MarR family n=1 Tax=Catenulispora acidiphila (strain DSM 44928 / JCM 14897 / NBRC 102108 / NRRL B-24433 / ID139908) TaxID=479433 RepID=C7PZ43_CATAD|nr:MarR family transcriptional regulator [Catenulispora acidiphila]ACU69599.1 transcriptional regulator, MarR family [Catenulispora acidiphila DSM 44928]
MTGDQRRAEPLSDEEYSELGKSMGMLFQRIMRSRKEPEGGQLAALGMLSRCGPVRSSDLAKELFLDQSTVSRHVAHLEADGLVEKVADPSDRRATQLHLTELGHKHIKDFWQQRIDAMREGFEHWDPEDLRTLTRLMTRYVEDFAAIIAKNQDAKNGPTTEDGSK